MKNENVPKHAQDLCAWFERVQRMLPWRQTRDPYCIWISEVMLQQTQVATVVPYYVRFIDRFPTLQALGSAEEQEVLTYWSGLGYYSRARNLHRGAQHLVKNYGGRFPKTRDEVLGVPGIGPYTAGAVLSIAFDLPEALVDGNVQRVFARFYAMGELLESKTAQAFFWDKARAWVERAHSPRIFNQALMELGATVCTKAQPKCGQCPLAAKCVAHRSGSADDYPKRKPRRRTEKLWWAALIQENKGRILLQQNAPGDWWSGLWDFPRLSASTTEAVEPTLRKALKREKHLEWKRALPWQEHTVTHHRIHVSPIVLGWKGKARSGKTQRWVRPEEAQGLPLSSLAKKILRSYEAEGRFS